MDAKAVTEPWIALLQYRKTLLAILCATLERSSSEVEMTTTVETTTLGSAHCSPAAWNTESKGTFLF